MSTMTTPRLVSPAQQNLIKTMQAERGLPAVGIVPEATMADARACIEGLKQIPRTDRQPRQQQAQRPQQRQDSPKVPDGRYAIARTAELANLPGDSKTLFVKVNTGKHGKWAGFLFVDLESGDNHVPVKDRTLKAAVLRAIAVNPLEASMRYGREVGRCGVCRIKLTDDDSRAMGIGPDCFEKLTGRRRVKADAAPYLAAAAEVAEQRQVIAPVAAQEMAEENNAIQREEARATGACVHCAGSGHVTDYDDDGIDVETGGPIMRPVEFPCTCPLGAEWEASRQQMKSMRPRLIEALRQGQIPAILLDGIGEDEVLYPEHRSELEHTVKFYAEHNAEKSAVAQREAQQERVAHLRKEIGRARREGRLDDAIQLEKDPAYIAARRAEFGF